MNSVYENSPAVAKKSYPLTGIEFPELDARYAPALSFGFYFPLQKKYNRVIKRSFDIVVSTILILGVLSWLIPLFAILIKLDSRGPVFFRQKRNRNGGMLFSCIKFRTMVVNEQADTKAAEKNDNRVTRFGNFLRHYHLDELPQLFNVLIGHMSVVGPRPYMVTENLYYETIVDKYAQRHLIKPGITGLAQSYGYFGSFHDLHIVQERVDLDIQYIQHWSLAMDIKILFRTFTMLLGLGEKKVKEKVSVFNWGG